MPEYHQIFAIAQRLAPTCPPDAMAGVCRAVGHKLSGNPASDAEIESALVVELGAASPHLAPSAPPLPEQEAMAEDGAAAQPGTPETDADPQNPAEPLGA